MWKLYQRRHLWLLQVYRLFHSFYGSLYGSNKENIQDVNPLGRRILSADNSSSPTGNDGTPVVPDCIPPSVEEFPEDLFTQEQRVHGALVVHFLVVAYICCMLAIVCDKYFVPCLKVISSYFKVPQDIAGATFMAVGTSSPELFSSVIGSFITEGDIGVGTIVGSAVFNILAVTGAAAFVVGTTAVELDWYPISRDCLMYIVTISTLVVIIHDNVVHWYEALILLLMFVSYLCILFFNSNVKDVTTATTKNVSRWWRTKRRRGITLTLLPKTMLDVDETSALLVASRLAQRYNSQQDSACPSSGGSSLMASDEASGESDTFADESGHFKQPPLLVPQIIQQKYIVVEDEDTSGDDSIERIANELEASLSVNLWQAPDTGVWRKLFYFLMWPPNFLFTITIPRCNVPERTKLFPITFFACIVWLGLLSYLCFWMVAIMGYTLGIPDTVAGITILAAGTCVPELVSSVIVVKNGMGNMALCNLIGSNIFDILFCLGLPWLVKTLMNESRSLVINSSALTYTTLILLIVVILFYVALATCRWKLNWRYGIIAFILYAGFLVIASMYESNVFGDFNPPPCFS